MKFLSFQDALSKHEPLYMLTNWFASQVGQGIVLVNVICASIFSFGLVRYCRKQPFPWIGLLISFPVLIIMVSLGYTRQSAGIGFVTVWVPERKTTPDKDSVGFPSLMLRTPFTKTFSIPSAPP